ncbi:MAG: hypothetical protein IPF81_13910 [Bacteroidetes bacterium]|nr:hypothetical protein [Bacteroidota bacterium]
MVLGTTAGSVTAGSVTAGSVTADRGWRDRGGGIGDGGRFVETRLIASPTDRPTTKSELTKKYRWFHREQKSMIHDNISRIVRWYKGRCTFEIRKINSTFAPQPRFHDHIIRDGFAFERIQNYIANNPSNWKEDTFHVGKYLNGNRNDNTVR